MRQTFKEALIGKILKPLKQLEETAKNHDEGLNPSLTNCCQWADSLDAQFDHAEYLVEEGKAFFNIANIERLKSIPLPEESNRLIWSLRWDYDKGEAKGK